MLGLRFCARAFSSCGERGPLFIAVHGPFTVAASLAAGHRLQTRRLSSCGSRAQLLRGTWDLPRPGLKPVSPALAGRFSTTAPPGKPPFWVKFCIWCKVRVQLHSFACGYPVFPAPFVEKTVLSSLNSLNTHIENHLTIYVSVYFWALYSIPLVYMSIFMPVPYCFDYYSFAVNFEIRSVRPPTLFFFKSFSYLGYLETPNEF